MSFYISLADYSKFAVDNLGAYLSAGPVTANSPGPLPFTPQVVNQSGTFRSSIEEWMLIQGSFVAVGGEDHLTIGNFNDDLNTPALQVRNAGELAYYFVDDVSVRLGGSACPADKTVECGTPWSFDTPTISDECCGTNITLTHTDSTNSSGCPIVITRTWTATDCCSNSATCSQSVTIIDNTPPVVNCPAPKTVQCGTPWVFDTPTATDACCGGAVTMTILNTDISGNCPQIHTRIWQFTDCCTNRITCTQVVTVVDTIAPVLTIPKKIKQTVCGNNAQVFFVALATDTCDTSVIPVCFPPSGSFFSVGTTMVNCTATDDCGNTISHSFSVVVADAATWQRFPGGVDDCYLAGNKEKAFRRACLLNAYPTAKWKDFDDSTVNRYFGQSWKLPLDNYLDGYLITRMKDNNCKGGSIDDTISLGLQSCFTSGWDWTRTLGPSSSDAGLQPLPWCHISGCDHLFSLHLSDLPVATGGSMSVMPRLNLPAVMSGSASSKRRFDMLVQDDIRVDYADLWLLRCNKKFQLGGFDLSLTNAQLVHGPDAWTIAKASGSNAAFSVTLELGDVSGVKLNFKGLSFAQATNGLLKVLVAYDDQILDAQDDRNVVSLVKNTTDTVSVLLGTPLPGVSNMTVEILSNGVVTSSQTLPASAGAEITSFPASMPVTSVSLSSSGAITVNLGSDGYSIRMKREGNSIIVWPFISVTLTATGFNELTLGQPEVGIVEPIDGEEFASATGDVVAYVANGQLAVSALDSADPGPLGITVRLATPTNELRAVLDATFGQFAPAPSNGSVKFTAWVEPMDGQHDDVFSLSFTGAGADWNVTAAHSNAPVALKRVEVWNNGVLVAAVANPASVSVSERPPVYWPTVTWFVDADICHRFPYSASVTVRVNGIVHSGNELRILWAEDDRNITSLTGVSVETDGAEAIVLSQFETGPVHYQLGSPKFEAGVKFFDWSGIGATVESAVSVLGPWSTELPVEGEIGASTTNGPMRFFRVRGQ